MRAYSRILLTAVTLAFAAVLAFAGSAFTEVQRDPANATLAFQRLRALIGHWQATTNSGKDTTSAALAFEKLRTLVGRWEAVTDKGTASATYELVAGGSALLERTNVPGEDAMISVYHLDGNRLLLTHYCMAGNQPRMQAGNLDPKTNQIDFQFLDATNLSGPDAGHMHEVVIKFQGPNEVTENWTFFKGGKAAFTVPLVYHRVD